MFLDGFMNLIHDSNIVIQCVTYFLRVMCACFKRAMAEMHNGGGELRQLDVMSMTRYLVKRETQGFIRRGPTKYCSVGYAIACYFGWN